MPLTGAIIRDFPLTGELSRRCHRSIYGAGSAGTGSSGSGTREALRMMPRIIPQLWMQPLSILHTMVVSVDMSTRRLAMVSRSLSRVLMR